MENWKAYIEKLYTNENADITQMNMTKVTQNNRAIIRK